MLNYVLDAFKNPKPEPNLKAWAEFMAHEENRRVGEDLVGGLLVSTVFLGLDHNWTGRGDPVLFETMVFDRTRVEQGAWRYCTWQAAEVGHCKVLRELRERHGVPRG